MQNLLEDNPSVIFILLFSVSFNLHPRQYPEPRVALTLIKPITWFPPMWAYLCGAVPSGGAILDNWQMILLGIILAGPVVYGTSQAANDWCDHHVDAINEPNRLIPSGRIPGRWGLWIALMMTVLSLFIGSFLGPWGFGATVFGVLAALAYSAEPVRLKRSGWWGPGLVGLCYEGLPWFTGAAILSAGAPAWPVIIIATLYAIGAHGIMALNSFKALDGDKQMSVNSVPVTLGPEHAAKLACWIMAVPQLIVVFLLFYWDQTPFAATVATALFLQVYAMQTLLSDPKRHAP